MKPLRVGVGGGWGVAGLEGTEGRGRRGSTHKLSDFAGCGARTDRVLLPGSAPGRRQVQPTLYSHSPTSGRWTGLGATPAWVSGLSPREHRFPASLRSQVTLGGSSQQAAGQKHMEKGLWAPCSAEQIAPPPGLLRRVKSVFPAAITRSAEQPSLRSRVLRKDTQARAGRGAPAWNAVSLNMCS